MYLGHCCQNISNVTNSRNGLPLVSDVWWRGNIYLPPAVSCHMDLKKISFPYLPKLWLPYISFPNFLFIRRVFRNVRHQDILGHPITCPNRHMGSERFRANPFTNSALERGGLSAPRPGRFTVRTNSVPIAQGTGWASGPVRTSKKNKATTEVQTPGRPTRSESLYRQRYSGRHRDIYNQKNKKKDFLCMGGAMIRASCWLLVFAVRSMS